MKQPLEGAHPGALDSMLELIPHLESPIALVDGGGLVRAASAGLVRGLGYGTPPDLAGRPIEGLGLGGCLRRSCGVVEIPRATGSPRRARLRIAELGEAALAWFEWEEPAPDPAAALAHDLRSPLCSVIGFARLAREELARGNADRAGAFLARIERSAATLGEVLRGALDPAPGGLADVAQVVDEIRAERKREFERKHTRLDAPIDAPTLACAPSLLYRVLSNLIGNALDHMGDPIDAAIRVSVECSGDLATLSVRDNGAGIARDECERVFVAGHSCAHDGSARPRGLGLAIVRDLAASWGGHAWAESAPGNGAAVHVTIPVAR